MTTIHGTCDERFAAVRDAFAANFDRGEDDGACVAVTIGGEPVVDLWAGVADVTSGRPWERDTIVNVYSTTKTMSFVCILMLADRGLVEINAPVATYWPEFAANGKDRIEVRHLLSHSAGLSGWDQVLTTEDLYDWEKATSLLAAQAPWWEPGTASGYHAVTQGYLLGEVVRRVDGRTIGQFFADEVAGPLGADFHIGLPASEDDRVAALVPPELSTAGLAAAGDIAQRTFASAPMTGEEPATTGWRRAEIPAAGGIGNARAVARIHSALACGGSVDGVRLMEPKTVDRIFETQIEGDDLVLGVPIRFGLGFGLPSAAMPISPSERACFWGGWGGSIAVIDVDQQMTVAYAMNRMAAGLVGDLRGGSLVLAAYQALQA
ncbi:MAG: serine hydrolase domain-containing protein [Actinomycetota bacterium]|nr:serine hydrolase domain-containing protein [Actinomycetota bacterium]